MNKLAFDRSSARTTDENGYMRIARCPLSKETVNPYRGEEIPGWESLGLDPERVYQVYRPGDELRNAAGSFGGVPLLLGHFPESAVEPQKQHRVGSVGTDVEFDGTYLRGTLIVTDANAIAAIESGAAQEISCAYAFDPVVESGEFEGNPYEIVMTRLRGNHVALVSEGRAGPDVRVADEAPKLPVATKGGNPVSRKKKTNIPEKGKKVIKVTCDEGLLEAVNEALEAVKEGADPGQVISEEIDEGVKAGVLGPDEEGSAMDNAELEALLEGLDPEKADAIRALFSALSTEAMDQCGTKTKDMDPMEEEKKKEPAMDAALVRRQAKDEAIKHFKALSEAAKLVEPICGRLDPLTFDSAESIYRAALDQAGIDRSGEPESSFRAMVNTYLAARSTAMDAAFVANNSGTFTGPFANLSRIRS